jgi:AbrB family looped-hinge helix DNA binding protein
MITETARIGKRGTIVIPAALRQKYGFEEGSQIIVEPVPEGVLLRPVVMLPIEIYTPERKAEFLLNNAITPDDYAASVGRVREMGLDPEQIPHRKPGKK